MPDDDEIVWHRASGCQDNSGCVEIHHGPDGAVYVRNSHDLLHMIRLSKEQWDEFIAAVVAGEFDLPG
jgi:hypothetical protein